MDGYLNDSGHPIFKFSVYGYSKKRSVPLEAMLDTGFTGFLDLPLVYCLKAGLILVSTADYVLADNSVSSTLLCAGTIALEDGTAVVGTISINFKSNRALLGMEFLRKTKSKLEIDTRKGTVNITGLKTPLPKRR